ncbi:MAG: transcription antitermination factor NusB [Clostridiales bacterium]|jgi:N utilization substance protein B|nr:transcription antitermination factor NusB [Clostridiales bacterium]
MSKRSIGRKSDRRHAFCLVFARDFCADCAISEDLDYYLDSFAEEGASEMDFILGEIQGVYAHLDTIDAYIAETSATWDISRISKVDLAIMRLAVYEILHDDKIPDGTSINEAVELAKAFSSEDGGKFVNGVLGKIVRKLREGDEADENQSL